MAGVQLTDRDNHLLDYVEIEWEDKPLLAKVEQFMAEHDCNAEAALIDGAGIGTCTQCSDPVRPDDDADSGHGTIHMACAGPMWHGWQ